MSIDEIAKIISAIALLVTGSGWVANLGLNQIQKRKLLAETGKAEIELGDSKTLNVTTLLSSAGQWIDKLTQEVDRQRASEDRCKVELEKACTRIDELNVRIDELEAIARRRDLELKS